MHQSLVIVSVNYILLLSCTQPSLISCTEDTGSGSQKLAVNHEDSFVKISFVLVTNSKVAPISLNLQVLGELEIPYALLEHNADNNQIIGRRNYTHIKHGKVFMYVNPPVNLKKLTFPGKSQTPVSPQWIESCRVFIGFRCNWNAMLARDIFLFTHNNVYSSSYVDYKRTKDLINPKIFKRITNMKSFHEFHHHPRLLLPVLNHSDISISRKNGQIDDMTLEGVEHKCNKTLRCTSNNETSGCDKQRLFVSNMTHDPLNSVISAIATRITDEPYVYLFMQNYSQSLENRTTDNVLPLTYKQIGNSLSFVSNNGLVLNSLVFISRKLPPSDGMSEALGPMSIASWVGLVLAYALTAIVFGVVKALTINNLDDSLYEYFLHYMLRIMNDDFKSSNKYNIPSNNNNKSRLSLGDIYHMKDELGRDFMETEWAKVRRNSRTSRRLSVPYSEKGNIDTDTDINDEPSVLEGNQGQISKAILHVTIRIVSFVLIASYEGKLYNSITFPKPHLISSFEELVASDQYTSIKVTREAVQGGQLRIPSLQFPTDEMTSDLMNETMNMNYTSNNNSFMRTTTTLKNTSKVVVSVTIEDCINWVESSSDPNSNNACIGYEFELRNLQKTHRFDKLVAKTNKKLLKNGLQSHRRTRGRSSRLFPGAFQISKWIMESGIMQLWNLAETSFTDSIGDATHVNQSKTFTIKDYMGLFTVYFVLLFLSCVLFMSEFVVWWTKYRYGSDTTKNKYNWMKNICTRFTKYFTIKSIKQFCRNTLLGKLKQVCTRLKSRKVKVRKIIQC